MGCEYRRWCLNGYSLGGVWVVSPSPLGDCCGALFVIPESTNLFPWGDPLYESTGMWTPRFFSCLMISSISAFSCSVPCLLIYRNPCDAEYAHRLKMSHTIFSLPGMYPTERSNFEKSWCHLRRRLIGPLGCPRVLWSHFLGLCDLSKLKVVAALSNFLIFAMQKRWHTFPVRVAPSFFGCW